MFVRLVDRKSGSCVASGDVSSGNVGSSEIRELLENSRLHLDDFGNVRNIFGEFTTYNVVNLVAVCD